MLFFGTSEKVSALGKNIVLWNYDISALVYYHKLVAVLDEIGVISEGNKANDKRSFWFFFSL